MTSPPTATHLLVDAHVHLHDCFDLSRFLEAARRNFEQQRQQSLQQPAVGVLLLTEVQGVQAFAELTGKQSQLNQQLKDWQAVPTKEDYSLRFVHSSGQVILVMAGRQVVTQEKIELLTLVTDEVVPDGLSLEKSIEGAIAADSIMVFPWGAGKWIGKRGQIVRDCLAQKSDVLFVGDNGGRPSFWPLPAFSQGHRALPGTDPLPLTDEVERPGSYGFIVEAPADWAQKTDKPGEALKQLLRSPAVELEAYGRSQSIWRFIKNQSLIRMS